MSQQINLFNPIFLKQKKVFAAITMVQALAVIFVFLLLFAIYAQWHANLIASQAADTTALLAKTKSQVIAVTAQFGTPHGDPMLDGQISKSESNMRSMQRIFDSLESGQFGDTKGYSAYFRSFSRQIVQGVWLTGVNINGAGNKIDLRGRSLHAELVPEYLRRLAHEPQLKDKTFSALDMQVPLVDATPDPDGKVTKPQVPANYIEFDLESTEVKHVAANGTGDVIRDPLKVAEEWKAK